MSKLRPITEPERTIVYAMLAHVGVTPDQVPVPETVSEYGDPFMGSINFDNDRPDLYAGDVAQCEYLDEDGEKVVLSLTVDKEGKLLDLDFWKSNFKPLVKYPAPDKVTFKEQPS
ncbi:hypothetical protein BFP72_16545 [Reichenbachiella sp. 5M10]|uniref:DUF6984 family protein n=1 Tax=Reichenbachiella sp. 5M10 TaxID=1889772 RepID=UPI000C4EAA11|nr:hypothetical protein [Reichenbachiella sp. 5M10]PIB36897.1 hypothetical protein BFP72_16545 [Reichenbachiella sp. 5M10]